MPKKINPAPKAGTKGFLMNVSPSGDHLQEAIAQNGKCKPRKCWHRVAIAAILAAWGASDNELKSIRVDAGHVKLNFRGYRYIANQLLHVKRSLMLFDKGRYDELYIRPYSLRFKRTTKLPKVTAERKKKIKVYNREWRKNNPDYVPPPATLRQRVEGFSSIV